MNNPWSSYEEAVDAVTNAVNSALTPEADKYAPKEATALQAKLADLKAQFDMKNYAGVILGRPDVEAAVAELTQTAATSRDAESKRLTAQWSDMSTSLPKSFDTVQSRIDELTKSKVADVLASSRTVKNQVDAAAAVINLQLPSSAG